jgi:hypothetical protein
MPLHESTDRAGSEHHKAHGEHDGGDHDGDLVGHSDSCDHRIKREDDIEQRNLHQHSRHRHAIARRLLDRGFTLKSLVNFMSTFPDQEHTSCYENQVAARNLVTYNGEEWCS